MRKPATKAAAAKPKQTVGVMFGLDKELHAALKNIASNNDRTLQGEIRRRLAESIRRDEAAKQLQAAE